MSHSNTVGGRPVVEDHDEAIKKAEQMLAECDKPIKTELIYIIPPTKVKSTHRANTTTCK